MVLQVREADRARVEQVLAATASPRAVSARRAPMGGDRAPRRRRPRRRLAGRPAPGVGEITTQMQRAARPPARADAGVRPPPRRGRSRALAGADLRSGGDVAAPFIATRRAAEVAILREQGVNGQVEMAAAFDRAGFDAVDVHMTDIIAGRVDARRLQGRRRRAAASPTATCSAAGEGWAKSILFNARARGEFERSSRAATPSRSARATAAR